MLPNFTKSKQLNNNNPSKKIIPLPSKIQGFIYHSDLDADYLYDFHGNDWEQALFSFELFLEITVKDVLKLIDALKKQETEQALSLIHKVRPGFLMVGLSDFSILFDNIKLKEFQDLEQVHLSQIVVFWWENFQTKLNIIQMERVRLEFFIKTNLEKNTPRNQLME